MKGCAYLAMRKNEDSINLNEYIQKHKLLKLELHTDLKVCMKREDFDNLKKKYIPEMRGRDKFNKKKNKFFDLLEQNIDITE